MSKYLLILILTTLVGCATVNVDMKCVKIYEMGRETTYCTPAESENRAYERFYDRR